jgi:hypothetical protein
MNRSRVTLCLSVLFFAASVVVLVRVKGILDETRSLRAEEASEDDLGDIFVLTHSPDNGDVLDGPEFDGFNALNAMMPPDADHLDSLLLLTPEQSARVRSVVESTNERIQRLLETPDSLGRTPRATIDQRRDLARRLLDAHPLARDSVHIEVLPVRFRDWTIGAGNRTYGEEITRLTSSARDEIAGCLGPEQRQKLERIYTYGLFSIPDGSGEPN